MSNTAKGVVVVLILIVIVGAVVLYGKNSKENTAVTKTETSSAKIGVIAPLTGILASYGEDMRKGVLAAVKSDEAVFEDDKCEPAAAVSVFNKLVSVDKTPVIIGPGCGSPQEAIVPILKDKNAVVIAPSSASEKLYSQSGGKFFNMQYSLEADGAYLARTMYARGHKKVVIISYQNAFSKVLSDSFKKVFEGEIVEEVTFLGDTSDISTDIAKLKGLKFDAILSTDVTYFFAQGMEKLKEYGITAPVYSQYAVDLPDVRPLAEGVYYSFPGGITGTDGATVALSTEAARMAKEAIGACKNDVGCIQKHLLDSGSFDASGISKRELVLKQIKNGQPTKI